MKILFIHPNLSRYATKQIFSLSKNKDISCFLLCGASDVSVFKDDEIEKSCNNIWSDLPVLKYPFQYKFLISRIKKIVKKYDIDLINVYSMPDDFAVAALKSSSVPVIFSLRDVTSTFSKEILFSRVKFSNYISKTFLKKPLQNLLYSYIKKMEKEAMEKSSGRIFSTPCMFDYSKKNYRLNKNNLVFLNYILTKELPKNKVEKLSKSDGIHIGFTGNITLDDNYRNFFPFFKKLAKNKINVHMHVVSNNKKNLNHIKSVSSKNKYLHYYPPMSPKKVIEFLTRYDYGILPFESEISYYDTILPNKLFDYLTAGLPIISSEVFCIKDFISKNKIGFSYKDFNDLIGLLKVNNPNQYKIKKTDYLMERHIGDLIKFYKKVIEGEKLDKNV